MNGTMEEKLASPKQLKWLRDLLERDYSAFPEDWRKVCDRLNEMFGKLADEGYEAESLNVWISANDGNPLTHNDFQKLLPKLQACPKVKQPSSAAPQSGSPIATTDGMYKKGDTFYKLRFTKAGKLWAHRLVFLLTPEQLKAKQEADIANGVEDKTSYVKFKFAGGPGQLGIREDMKLSHEDAKAFGVLYGMCVNCGRLLTNEVSIHLGIGPVCGGRQFGGEFKFMIKEAELAVAPKK